MSEEYVQHTLTVTANDDDVIREVKMTRHQNGNTEFLLKTLYADQSEPLFVHLLLKPQAVKLMRDAMIFGMMDAEKWKDLDNTTAPAPGQEGGAQ